MLDFSCPVILAVTERTAANRAPGVGSNMSALLPTCAARRREAILHSYLPRPRPVEPGPDAPRLRVVRRMQGELQKQPGGTKAAMLARRSSFGNAIDKWDTRWFVLNGNRLSYFRSRDHCDAGMRPAGSLGCYIIC